MGYSDCSPDHTFISDSAYELVRKHKTMLEKMHSDSKWYGRMECIASICDEKGNIISESDTSEIGSKGEWEPVIHNDLPWCQIYDIDGTLAIRGERGAYDWDRVGEDTVNEAVKHIISCCYDADLEEDCPDDMIFITGRKEICRDKTLKWLCENDVYQKYHRFILFMRKEDDNRDDVIVKEEMYNEHIKGKYNVRFVVDDRPKVCRMWRALGLPLFQVGDPDKEF